MYGASLITDVLPVLVNRMSFWLQGQGFLGFGGGLQIIILWVPYG